MVCIEAVGKACCSRAEAHAAKPVDATVLRVKISARLELLAIVASITHHRLYCKTTKKCAWHRPGPDDERWAQSQVTICEVTCWPERVARQRCTR